MRWLSSSAFVSGPTPPGTGVIAEATFSARPEVDVADDLAVDDVDPDVDDDRAGLEHVAGHEPRLAGGDDHDVRPADLAAARSRVFEWQTVTVASSLVSMNASGMPTTGDRPMTTASAPRSSTPGAMDHLQRGMGRRGHEALVAEAEQAGVQRVDAVDVLERIDGVDHRPQPDARRERHLDDDPGDARVVVERADRRGRARASWLGGVVAVERRRTSLRSRPGRRP